MAAEELDPFEDELDEAQEEAQEEGPDETPGREPGVALPAAVSGSAPKKRGRPKIRIRGEIPFRILAIDFKKPPADQVLPCSIPEQAYDLGWPNSDVRSVNQSHGIYTKLPMICQGERCFWAKQCPTAPDFLFLNYSCPLQVMEAYSRFVELVNELGVGADDNVDLDMISDLVRIDLQMKEIDMRVAVEGQMTDVALAIWPKTGEVKYGRGVHPLLDRQHKLRADRNKIYGMLIASRDAKEKKKQSEGKKEVDLLNAFEKIAALGLTARGGPAGAASPAGPSTRVQDSLPPALSDDTGDPEAGEEIYDLEPLDDGEELF